MLYVVLSTMLVYLIHLVLPKILTYKNHRDFSPIQVRLARDSNIPDYVSRMHSADILYDNKRKRENVNPI